MLEPLGWTRRKAERIALVCLHSGVFTRAEWARFMEAQPEQLWRGVHALIARGLAAEETVPGIRGIGRVCRIYARSLYGALGAEHIRHRRDASPAVLMRRLFSLDYLMERATCLGFPAKPRCEGSPSRDPGGARARRRGRCGALSGSIRGCGGRACRPPLRRESQLTLLAISSRYKQLGDFL